MAKVLKSKRGDSVACPVSSGGRYHFLVGSSHEQVGGVELIMNDKDAEELLAKYDFLEAVPESKWSDVHKAKVAEYRAIRMKEAAEQFPELVKEKVFPKAPKEEKEK